jgi:hypothetical protein
MAILLLSVKKLKKKKLLKKIESGPWGSSPLLFSLPGRSVSLLDLPSHIAAGKRVGRERGWPLAVTDRGLPLVGVRAVQI